MKYTQNQWDREVGWGKVPDEYNIEITTNTPDGKNIERSQENREENERPIEEGKLYKMNDLIWDKRWTE